MDSGGCRRICLITTGQPSTNPRLVKEADALVEAGYDVQVLGAFWAEWASPFDAELLATRPWRFEWIDWRRTSAPWLFFKSRVRHHAAIRIASVPLVGRPAWNAALSRVTPELVARARHVQADLYIAHNLGALPAAIAAARRWSAPVGFDAEDYHSGQATRHEESRARVFLQQVERRLLPRCSYVTAASPLIADAYAKVAGVSRPVTILNTFPLRDRPAQLRHTEANAPLRLYWFSQTIGRERGLEDVVRAMGRLQCSPVELHVRGAWQPGYREEVLRLADEHGVARERVIAHAPASSDAMVRLAAEYDVGLALEPGISPNNDFALSNKILVYLLGGLAVVASNTAAQAAFAANLGKAACTYEPGQAEALAAILEAFIEDPQRLTAAREAAWRIAETRYNWEVEKTKFLAVVRDALARGHADVRKAAENRRGDEAAA